MNRVWSRYIVSKKQYIIAGFKYITGVALGYTIKKLSSDAILVKEQKNSEHFYRRIFDESEKKNVQILELQEIINTKDLVLRQIQDINSEKLNDIQLKHDEEIQTLARMGFNK
jgi:hypothetical protein